MQNNMPVPYPNPLPSQEVIRAALDYRSDTGEFFWRERADISFKVNARFSGKPAGSWNTKRYLSIKINGVHYRAHRLAWVYVYGTEPPHLVDHADGNPANNRIDNIRVATVSQNQQNKRGKIGRVLPKGVKPNRKRFSARVSLNKKVMHLGTFDTPELAHAAYVDAIGRLFGDFARPE